MELQTLSNGRKIPVLGLGTWFIDDDKAAQAVVSAVEIGYRHIDTAQAYGNERGVGVGIRTCGKRFSLQARWRRRPKPMTQPPNPSMHRSKNWVWTISI